MPCRTPNNVWAGSTIRANKSFDALLREHSLPLGGGWNFRFESSLAVRGRPQERPLGEVDRSELTRTSEVKTPPDPP